jgi:hypothetical protein
LVAQADEHAAGAGSNGQTRELLEHVLDRSMRRLTRAALLVA